MIKNPDDLIDYLQRMHDAVTSEIAKQALSIAIAKAEELRRNTSNTIEPDPCACLTPGKVKFWHFGELAMARCRACGQDHMGRKVGKKTLWFRCVK